MDLQRLLTQKATPQLCGGLPTYFKVQPHMSWAQFLTLLPPETPDLGCWRSCTQCRRSWSELSTLATLEGEPVFLGGSPDDYPVEAQNAVREYQRSFRKSQVADCPVRYINSAERNDPPNLGRHSMGGFPHAFLETGLTIPSPDLQEKVSDLIHQELQHLERYLIEWAPNVVARILDWYNVKGETAAGYRINTGGLRFLNALHTELADVSNPRLRRCVVLRHMLELFSGEHPADACGAIHVFSNGSNMAACRYASTPEVFWRIMDQRYNPATYRQPTSTPSEGQVKAALQLVDNDLSCFERERLAMNDPQVVSRALWLSSATNASSRTSITADQLLEQVRSKNGQRTTGAKATCFDSQLAAILSKSQLLPDQFDQWLAALPAGTRLEYRVQPTSTPIELAQPTTDKGREMVKVPVSWAVPIDGSRSGLKADWHMVRQILPHPGRWRSEAPFIVPRDQAIVSDGYVIVLEQPHTWRPEASCLFAEFFRGEYHSLDKTRQELQRSLRMSDPAEGEPIHGLMIECKRVGITYRLRNCEIFRATMPDSRVLVVSVT